MVLVLKVRGSGHTPLLVTLADLFHVLVAALTGVLMAALLL